MEAAARGASASRPRCGGWLHALSAARHTRVITTLTHTYSPAVLPSSWCPASLLTHPIECLQLHQPPDG